MTRPYEYHWHADLYRRYRPTYPPELYAWLAGLVRGRHVAWDCATGNGQAALGLADHFTRVVATDASVEQLRRAYPHERVRYAAATAEAAPLRDASVDLVTVAQALHWLGHDAFYREVRRVARPGAVLAAWVYTLFSVDPQVDAVMTHFHHDVLGPWWPPQRAHVRGLYRTLPFPFDEIDDPGFVMRPRWTRADLLAQVSTWSAVARCRAGTGRDPIPLLAERVCDVWPDEGEVRDVDWPIHARVGRL